MANNKMLIDAAHPEETRVVMVRGNRIDEFDFESEHKTQLRGNIYLAKVTRVEPSLQAAFVDYGGNRHGFLAFSEIHPDYYQIPVADRQALLDAEAEDARAAAAEEAEADAAVEDGDVAEASEEKPARKRRSRRRGAKKAADTEESSEAFEDAASDATAEVVEGDDQETVETASRDSGSSNDSDEGEESDSDDTTIAAENDGDDVVSEPASNEPPKKPRRRTSRKKAEPEAKAKAESEPDPQEAAKEEAPKKAPKRRTSRKKVVAEKEEAEETSQATAEPKSENDNDGEPEAEEKPKKTRRRSSRAKKSDENEPSETDADAADSTESMQESETAESEAREDSGKRTRSRSRSRRRKKNDSDQPSADDENGNAAPVEDLGTEDAMGEVPVRRAPRRHYKIQEVIKRRQILLVQVVKEERGNKGAALTTYLSLAGRYSVLMPNTARGGGISRKITNAADRKRLKSVANGLDVPQGMGVILRTAGAARKPEDIQRDFEYLMRLWENVRTLTLESTAPCLVYEEGSLIKRSIRDLYDADTSEILVAGEAGHREAKDFMNMLMPNHAKNVKLYRDRIPMFARMGVESQLDAMLQPQVTLKSGGYLIIDQTEALVAIDVNSGRSTRQHSVEDTAAQTNLEAADEVARQLRLRDLAGLIVIDFIDMEDKRNIRNVEKRLKDALKNDRARIQVGRISHFGLMEMSRQRIRASVLESTTQVCPTCEGLGHVRAASSVVLSVLRSIEEHLNRNSRNDLSVKVSTPTALYLLNNKRDNLGDLETRFGVSISIATADDIGTIPCVIEKGELSNRKPADPTFVSPDTVSDDVEEAHSQDTSTQNGTSEVETSQTDQSQENGEGKKRRRRRRKRKNSDGDTAEQAANEDATAEASAEQPQPSEETAETADASDEKPKRRSRRAKKPAEEPAVETESATDAAPEESKEAAEEKPKPRKRRTKKSEEIAEKPDAVAVTADEETSEPATPKRRTTRRKTTQTVAAENEVTEVVAEASASTPEAQQTEAKADDTEPKKAGWWQRKFF